MDEWMNKCMNIDPVLSCENSRKRTDKILDFKYFTVFAE